MQLIDCRSLSGWGKGQHVPRGNSLHGPTYYGQNTIGAAENALVFVIADPLADVVVVRFIVGSLAVDAVFVGFFFFVVPRILSFQH